MGLATPEADAALAAALAAVQAELPEVKKTRSADVTNKDGKSLYSYAYADLADASAAILPILGKHGLAFTAFPGHQPDGKFGLRYYLLHAGGGSIEGFFEIGDQGGMQMVGGRITYARRYCLCAVTGIAAEDDVDAREDAGASRKAQRRQPASGGGQQSQGTAQRRQRGPGSQQQERDDTLASLPPLPEGNDAPPPAAPRQDAPEPAARIDRDMPGTVTGPQLRALWTTLSGPFGFASTDADKEVARMACAVIIGRDLASTKNLSLNEAKKVYDTLSELQGKALKEGGDPRDWLMDLLQRTEEARAQDAAAGREEGAGGGE